MGQDRPPDEQVETPVSPGWRTVLSLALGLHLAAVVSAPFAAPPSSFLAQSVWSFFRPYLEAAYLNHGYKFFAPDPGPGTLVRYELEMPDGSRREGIFPNRHEQWPRLLYHRHMMLADRLAAPQEMPWLADYVRSYARHLHERHGARRVTLYLVRHAIPFPQQVERGMKLDDPSLYQERKLLVFPEDADRTSDPATPDGAVSAPPLPSAATPR